ncbi:MAG: ABC transporter permease [Nitrospiraceae bacterium]
MTSFPLRMAWRETRAGWRHFLYFFLCIALGVGGLVGVALFASNVERTVTREARGLMAGDLEIRLSRSMTQDGETIIKSLVARGIVSTHVSELVAMAAAMDGGPTRPTQLSELKAVEAGYPFYGTLRLEPDRPLAELLATSPCASRALADPPKPLATAGTAHGTCYGAVVQESLLIRMGLSVGDRLKIGQALFTITGVLRKEPDRAVNLFSLGPRVMISREGLAAADLIKPGSRVRERYLLRVPETAMTEALLFELRGRLAGESARVIPFREAQPQLRRFLDQLTRYLGLIGLTALFVGGIGVACTVHAFLREKLNTIAILKTLGAGSDTVLRTYLFQAILLGLIGSLAGAALGTGFQAALPALLAGLLPSDLLDVTTTLSPLPLLKGIAMGILTTLLFALWPLLNIRDLRPALVFRRDVAPIEQLSHTGETAQRSGWGLNDTWGSIARDPSRSLVVAGVAVGLAGLAVWQAGSFKIGLLFIGALSLAVAILTLATAMLIRTFTLFSGSRSLAVRYAIGNLYRPGSQTIGVMVSIGIGVMVIVAVSLVERSLVQQLGESRPIDAPTFFFIDIQPDQKDTFLRLIRDRMTDSRPEITPLVRSRLRTLNGRPVQPDDDREGRQGGEQESRKSWYFTREYVLTFLDQLPKDNVITKGAWWSPSEVASSQSGHRPVVSVEEEAAKHLGVDLGSIIEFDIQGAAVSAEVTSIRKVEWGNFSTNFYMILSPGSLEGAPFTYVGTVRVLPDREVPLQQAVVAAFPNVTAINIGDVLDSLARILERLSLAIRAVALFCILAGAIVMAAALATTRYRRLYESVILKAVGATRGLVGGSFAIEYALMGAVAGLIGIVLANALAWAILHFILDLPWTMQPGILATGFALTVLLTLAVGFFSTFRILGQPPLTVLRHE